MNASFKQIDPLKLFIAFKMAYSCCFSFGGNLDFPEFLQKKFYNINLSSMEFFSRRLVSAQLSNKFGYCPSCTTLSIVLAFHKHYSLPLGKTRAFTSCQLLPAPPVQYSSNFSVRTSQCNDLHNLCYILRNSKVIEATLNSLAFQTYQSDAKNVKIFRLCKHIVASQTF